MLNELTYAAALARLRENEGRGLSAQSYALREKIFEVDACVESDPRIREVHPEISFTTLAESPLGPKKTRSGFDQRARLLRKNGVWLSPDAFELKGVGATMCWTRVLPPGRPVASRTVRLGACRQRWRWTNATGRSRSGTEMRIGAAPSIIDDAVVTLGAVPWSRRASLAAHHMMFAFE